MTADPTSALTLGLVIAAALLALGYFLLRRAARERGERPSLARSERNPILEPSERQWENEAVFNPAAWYDGERVHLLYRALGREGVSRIGYASSEDGVHFTREPSPAFALRTPARSARSRFANPFASARYDRGLFASGGGWGGSEDPRVVEIGGRVYMTFGVFESWESVRIALTSIGVSDFLARAWEKWAPHGFLSPEGETHKNWVLFPEKIGGKFAVLHALSPQILIDYADSPEEWFERHVQSCNRRGGRAGAWDAFVRGAAAPPLKTPHGWLLLYHGFDPAEGPGYKVGAMLLDLADPAKILHRASAPVIEPREWYENDWKPGVVYASGAIVKDDTLFVYYGGGDKRVNVATAPLRDFLRKLMRGERPSLSYAM